MHLQWKSFVSSLLFPVCISKKLPRLLNSSFCIYLFQCFTEPTLACAKCICRCQAPFQGCPALHTNQQPYRICQQGLRACLDCHQGRNRDVRGSVSLLVGDQSETRGQCWLDTFCYASSVWGVDWGWNSSCGPRAKVNLCTSPSKISVSKLQSKLIFNNPGSISTLISKEP